MPLMSLLACALEVSADDRQGPLPFTTTLTAEGFQPEEAHWDFGDGATADGASVEHTWFASGVHTVSVSRGPGEDAVATIKVKVDAAACPEAELGEAVGTVADPAIDEASGLVDSRANAGVLWTHNDSGDSPRLFGLSHAGELLAILDVEGVSSGDWEDLALGTDPETGGAWLIAGDIGDNSHARDDVHLRIVEEPRTEPGQDLVELGLSARSLDLTYPDGEMLDSEAMLFDPVTQDILLVTKDYGGEARIYRKPAPHLPDTTTELELLATLDFSASPLTGGATTGADISPLGDLIVIRTYGSTAYVFRRDQAFDLADAFSTEPCPVKLVAERQGETIAFAADSAGLYTLSEGENQPINYVPFAN